jgi:hypothetical protein
VTQNGNGQGGSGNQGGGGSARRKQRRRSGNRGRSVDLWRPVPQLPDPEPIAPATDPGMVLRSLGTPPLQGQGAQAEHAFELVVRRSSALASALAAAAGLLAQPGDDE